MAVHGRHAREIDHPEEITTGETAPPDDFRRGRLAALGKAIGDISALRAVVQLPEGGPWVLYVTHSYLTENHKIITCDKVRDAWGFYWAGGTPICSAHDAMQAAQTVAAALIAPRP